MAVLETAGRGSIPRRGTERQHVLGVLRIACDSAKVEDQVRLLARTLTFWRWSQLPVTAALSKLFQNHERDRQRHQASTGQTPTKDRRSMRLLSTMEPVADKPYQDHAPKAA